MSRGVRDLRELICVSRLTIRESDDEIITDSDNDDQDIKQKPDSASSGDGREAKHSPDSGIVTNGGIQSEGGDPDSPGAIPKQIHPHPPSNTDLPAAAKKKRRKKKRQLLSTASHDLPRPAPLPPVGSIGNLSSSRPSSSSSLCDGSRGASARIARDFGTQPIAPGNFDYLLNYMDSSAVSEWLHQSNQGVTDLTLWCHEEENYVHFAHFWLSDFPDHQKQNIFKLEHSILLDQLGFAFTSGRDSGEITNRDIKQFLEAVFREYPAKLMSSKGPHLFLQHLEILTSERQDAYRSLLSDVKCSTRIKQNAQWILATRSFALVSVWTAVANFFRRLLDESPDLIPRPKSARPGTARPRTARPQSARPDSRVDIKSIANKSVEEQHMYDAISCGYVDVVYYLLATKKVQIDYKDHHGRTLLFSAVMQNQIDVLNFFLQMTLKPDVNAAADTGNTALHAVANTGNVPQAEALLKSSSLIIDPTNPQCENATPLHLAIMHGHTEIVKMLLSRGAVPQRRMGDLTAIEMAYMFGEDDMKDIFKEAGFAEPQLPISQEPEASSSDSDSDN